MSVCSKAITKARIRDKARTSVSGGGYSEENSGTEDLCQEESRRLSVRSEVGQTEPRPF